MTPFPLKFVLKVTHHPLQKQQFRPISAHSASTVRAGEKSSLSTNMKSTTRFPTSHRWIVYVKVESDSYIAQLTRWLDQRALQSRKWQLIGKSQWCCSADCGHPIARVNVQLDPRYAASKHTTAPINHTRPSPSKHSSDDATPARKQTSDYSLLLILSTSKGWKAESTCVAGYIPK